MDFEQRVQEHNVDIAFIRDGIRGLPSEEEIREQASSGKYVWKKYELKVIRFKVTSSSNAREWWFSSEDIDFGTVTNEFFDGITFVANGVTITITPTEFSYGGNKSPYTWNPSSKHIVTQTNYVHADVNVEAEKEEKTFVAYATNDSPTAYPDNVEKDGYWYEKLTGFEGISEARGFSKIAVDKTVFSAKKNATAKIPHSLGDIPKEVLIFTDENIAVTESMVTEAVMHYRGSNQMRCSYWYHNGDFWSDENVSNSSFTKTTFSLSANDTTRFFKAGVEYTIITMA